MGKKTGFYLDEAGNRYQLINGEFVKVAPEAPEEVDIIDDVFDIDPKEELGNVSEKLIKVLKDIENRFAEGKLSLLQAEAEIERAGAGPLHTWIIKEENGIVKVDYMAGDVGGHMECALDKLPGGLEDFMPKEPEEDVEDTPVPQEPNNAYNDQFVQARLQGFTPTEQEGIFFKDGEYYDYDEKTKTFNLIDKSAFKTANAGEKTATLELLDNNAIFTDAMYKAAEEMGLTPYEKEQPSPTGIFYKNRTVYLWNYKYQTMQESMVCYIDERHRDLCFQRIGGYNSIPELTLVQQYRGLARGYVITARNDIIFNPETSEFKVFTPGNDYILITNGPNTYAQQMEYQIKNGGLYYKGTSVEMKNVDKLSTKDFVINEVPEYEFPKVINSEQDAAAMKSAAEQEGLTESPCAGVYQKTLPNGETVYFVWNPNDAQFERKNDIASINADGTFTVREAKETNENNAVRTEGFVNPVEQRDVSNIPALSEVNYRTQPGATYRIETYEDLAKLNEIIVSGYGTKDTTFILNADIDLSGHDFQIGDESHPFAGIFDGNGHTISNYTHYNQSTLACGLFGVLSGGTIKNLGLENIDIDGSSTTGIGGIVGKVHDGTISNCYVTGKISGPSSGLLGGIVGSITSGNITDCNSNVVTYNANKKENGNIAGAYSPNTIISGCNSDNNTGYRYEFPELLDKKQDAVAMKATAKQEGMTESPCAGVYSKTLSNGEKIFYVWNSNDKQFEVLPDIASINADGSYTDKSGKSYDKYNNQWVQAQVFGLVPTEEEGLFFNPATGEYVDFIEDKNEFVKVDYSLYRVASTQPAPEPEPVINLAPEATSTVVQDPKQSSEIHYIQTIKNKIIFNAMYQAQLDMIRSPKK